MMHYVNRAFELHGDKIDAIPDDEEVKALEEREAAKKRLHAKLTAFDALPRSMQVVHLGGTILLLLTSYALVLGSSRLFKPFGLRDCPETLSMPPYDFIPSMSWMGFVALVGLALGCLCMYIFSAWAARKVNAMCDKNGDVLDSGERNVEGGGGDVDGSGGDASAVTGNV